MLEIAEELRFRELLCMTHSEVAEAALSSARIS